MSDYFATQYHYTVSGTGLFPLDVYLDGQAHGYRPEDRAAMHNTRREARSVSLVSLCHPNETDWKEAGWTVSDINRKDPTNDPRERLISLARSAIHVLRAGAFDSALIAALTKTLEEIDSEGNT